MDIRRQLGLVIGFGYAAELAALFLPVRIPAGVLGILFVFCALRLGLVRPRHFGVSADFISAHMAFFFLPLAAAILQNYPAIRPVIVQVTLVCVLSTLVTFTVSYGTVRLLRIIMPPGKSLPPGGDGRSVKPASPAGPPAPPRTEAPAPRRGRG
jgi:holin-like protein